MPSSPASIPYLVGRYVAGDCSPEELEQFFNAASSEQHREEIAAALLSVWGEGNNASTSWLNKELIFERMQQQIPPVPSIPAVRPRTGLYRAIGWAAAVVIMVGAAVYYFSENNKISAHRTAAITTDILPGSDKVKLTTADGREILLDNSGAAAGDLNIKTANSQLSYTGNVVSSMHTMTTPKGRTFSVRLSDGSIIWLNAASSITYPTVFTGDKRTITITGEAYLDIAPSKIPFVVDVSGRSKVLVLGTEININAYADEPTIKTTLLTGSVRVDRFQQSLILKPGQQSQTNDTGMFKVISEADTDQVTAWKNGIFDFNNTSTHEVFRELSRWYNIEVSFTGNVSERKFNGQIGRDLNLSQVLKGLKGMELHFSLNGNKLTVTE